MSRRLTSIALSGRSPVTSDLGVIMIDSSFDDCGGPYDLSPEHIITSYELHATTGAEDAVIRFLSESPARHAGKALMHVGIGNGSMFALIGASLRSYTGITISEPEIEGFRRKFSDAQNARTVLVNKHDGRMFETIGNNFDIIVDVNLKSFACCEKHYQATMVYFANALSDRGMIVTAQSGIDFGWAGNTAMAYTPGADVNPATGQHRILGAEGLARLGADLGLAVSSVLMPSTDRYDSEMLWFLTKA